MNPGDTDYLTPKAKALLQLLTDSKALLQQLRQAQTGELKSRELSLATTNVEQGVHWLVALGASWDDPSA